jgi:2-keto-4-pentenoate hydratase/2-oxohepta-3-ene-1,7-dioic acid hydratase in catechol pathway
MKFNKIEGGNRMHTIRLLTYRDESGPRAGVAINGQVHDVARSLDVAAYASVRGILEDWEKAEPLLQQIAEQPGQEPMPLDQLELLPPVFHPGAIYCAGANYRDHVDNMARRLNIAPEPDPHELGLSPWHFIKSSWCVVGQGAKVELDSEFLDWEAELGVVIGRLARHVPLDQVFDYVAGYTVGNDLSARDRIARDKVDVQSPFRYDWIGQKNFDGACPLGPWIVPAREIANPQSLGIRTYVNDVVKQDSNTRNMLFSIAEQISYLSSRITLHPGDVIMTGTPAGVGAETGERLRRGDRVRVEIESIGQLVTEIV